MARGNDSLSTLSCLRDLGPAFHAVLGNHDLHLLSVAHDIKPVKMSDRLGPLLQSPRLQEFVDWIRTMPLARLVDENTLMTHAGLFPLWSFADALSCSDEVSHLLTRDDYATFLPHMYTSKPTTWDAVKNTQERPVFIINAMTRMRFLDKQNTLDFKEKRSPNDVKSALRSWFEVDNANLSSSQRVVFGHWASLLGQTGRHSFIGLDTGYVWGGHLSCWCVETNKITKISA